MTEILNVSWSVLRDTSVRVIMYLYKIGCFLVRGISLPVAQLFVIAIENILRGGCTCSVALIIDGHPVLF